MKFRTAAASGVAALALAAPASAATLEVDRPCYAPGEPIQVQGTGFTPGGPVSLSVSGRQLGVGAADAEGVFPARLTAPPIDAKRQRQVFTATDQTDLAITADANVLLTSLAVVVRPKRGKPSKPRRVRARGFTRGRALFAHVRGRGLQRDLRIGRLKGPCGAVKAKQRLFPRGAKTGAYRIQFDTKRRYSKRTRPKVTFAVSVYRRLRASAATAAAGPPPLAERWRRIG